MNFIRVIPLLQVVGTDGFQGCEIVNRLLSKLIASFIVGNRLSSCTSWMLHVPLTNTPCQRFRAQNGFFLIPYHDGNLRRRDDGLLVTVFIIVVAPVVFHKFEIRCDLLLLFVPTMFVVVHVKTIAQVASCS